MSYNAGGYQSFGGDYDGGNMGGGYITTGMGTGVSPSTPASGQKTTKSTTVTPVSIHQIKGIEMLPGDEALRIDGKDIGQVTIVGVVRSIERKETKTTFSIEDHTGVLDVIHWEDDASMKDPSAECREQMYVHVTGHAKTFGDKRQVNAFMIRPVTDFNEVTYHLLAIIEAHLHNTRGPITTGKPGAAGVVGGLVGSSAGGMAAASAAPGASDYGRTAAPAFDNASGLTAIQQQVLGVLTSGSSESGVSRATVIERLEGKFSVQQLNDALEWLSAEGHIYSTIDDDHFKSTDD